MKVLILRFSSFGDVTQCLSVPSKILENHPTAEIHWAVREDLAELLQGHPALRKVWLLSRDSGFLGLVKFGFELRAQNFTHLYDAHNNLRSHVLTFLIRCSINGIFSMRFIRKSQKRWKRFLLFQLRVNTYQKPLSGQRDLLEPLAPWGVGKANPPTPQLFVDDLRMKSARNKLADCGLQDQDFVALAASSAYPLKRWPLSYWDELIAKFPEQKFILLGGPEDKFLQELSDNYPLRVANFAGRCSLMESAALVKLSQALVTNDTGLLHVAEQLGHPAIALMGPAPFGFPSRPQTKILELDLACRPCSKHGQGPCVNPNYHQCLRGISSDVVASHLQRSIEG